MHSVNHHLLSARVKSLFQKCCSCDFQGWFKSRYLNVYTWHVETNFNDKVSASIWMHSLIDLEVTLISHWDKEGLVIHSQADELHIRKEHAHRYVEDVEAGVGI